MPCASLIVFDEIVVRVCQRLSLSPESLSLSLCMCVHLWIQYVSQVPSIPSGGGSPGLDTDKIRALQLSEFLQDELSDLLSKFPQLPIAYLATAKSRTSYHPTLQMTGPGLFTTRVEIKPPDQSTRVLVLKSFFSKLDTPDRQRKPGHGNMTYVILHPEANLDAVALDCEGYTGQDLQRMIQKAIHVATARALIDREQKNEITPLNVIVNQSDLDHARKDFIPNALKDLPPALESETKWSDIGGLEDVKSTLKETLQLPTRFSRIFSQLPLKLRSGLLLYGPPGCGKTLLASAVAAECGLNFVSIKGPELLNKYIGASEQAVRDAFERAAAASPCVLFLDEFEAIAPKRGGDSTGVTDRVVNQFLTLLDGVEGRTGVYVLAATSRPDLIDPALLRPGRLDKCLYCKLPDASDRARILLAIAHKMKLITQTVSEEKVTQYLALAKKSPLGALSSLSLSLVLKSLSLFLAHSLSLSLSVLSTFSLFTYCCLSLSVLCALSLFTYCCRNHFTIPENSHFLPVGFVCIALYHTV